MKRLCATLLSVVLMCSILVLSVSAGGSYEGNGFSIETALTGKWSEKEEMIGGFECTVYTFSTEGNRLIITINESDPQGFVSYVEDELVPESYAYTDGAEFLMPDNYAAFIIDIDEQEFSIVEAMMLNGDYNTYDRPKKTLYAYSDNEQTGYYIEMVAESDTEYYLLFDSIRNMEISPEKPGVSKGISGISDDEINITTIVCVGIITFGIVALGVTAMVIFGKKKKQ